MLGLSVSLCAMGLISVPTSQGVVVRITLDNTQDLSI